MSGHTDHALLRQGLLEPGVELIEKPFTPDALVRRVRGMMMPERYEAGPPSAGA
jgi:hypothetical protein